MYKSILIRFQAAFALVALASQHPVFVQAGIAASPNTLATDVLKKGRRSMIISKNGTRPVNKGSAEYFRGNVEVEPLVSAEHPARVQAACVRFEPGAHSAWHTHPLGQTLIVTEGSGVVQSWGEPAKSIKVGDVIWTPPGVKHWHGALPNSKMTHIAILEHLDGKNVDWLDHLTESQYRSACAALEQEALGLSTVSPALQKYYSDVIAKLWQRQPLSARDRSIITLSALIARNQSPELPHAITTALDNGVTPSEVSELITHLAFYSGLPTALAGVHAANVVFAQRNIAISNLPAANPELMPLNEEAEAVRAANVEKQFGATAPSFIKNTTDILFRDLWLRPGLKPRDRSLVTVSALIAAGQVNQVTYHLNRAMDNGLTQPEAAEALNHLAFYVGWPNIFSALPIVKDVFEKRK